MFQMRIDNFDVYFDKVKKILDNLDEFCASIETENKLRIAKGETNEEIKDIVEKIKNIGAGKKDKGEATKEKTIGYLIQKQHKFFTER